MTLADKWNRRFSNATLPASPCSLLQTHQHLLPTAGRALDLACGLGGNAVAMSQHGLQTDAWDISDIALDKLSDYTRAQKLPVETSLTDIRPGCLPERVYDVICVSRFLDRSLCADLIAALRPGGILFYQTFMHNKLASGGPSSKARSLSPGVSSGAMTTSGSRAKGYQQSSGATSRG